MKTRLKKYSAIALNDAGVPKDIRRIARHLAERTMFRYDPDAEPPLPFWFDIKHVAQVLKEEQMCELFDRVFPDAARKRVQELYDWMKKNKVNVILL